VSELSRVLITVKASPEPSKTYGDTVCVAGIRLSDSANEWVRIYPVAFRHLNSDKQFRKYEIIRVDLHRSSRDTRLESYRPNWETLHRESSKPLAPRARGPILERMIGPTMCGMRSAVEQDRAAPSLGLVEVRELGSLRFEEHGPWSDAQIRNMQQAMSQPDILGEVDTAPILTPPRYKVKYRYRCASENCRGHEQRILDWEMNALQYHSRHLDDSALKSVIERKFHTEMWNSAVRTCFFVGNFADPVKRKDYSVLGVYRRPVESDWGSTLF
jgi:hypothetical protein